MKATKLNIVELEAKIAPTSINGPFPMSSNPYGAGMNEDVLPLQFRYNGIGTWSSRYLIGDPTFI